MAGPRNATTTRGGGRFYDWRSERYWSVTTIIGGGLPKPVLVNWAKKFTAEYAVNHFDALTTLVRDDPDGAVEWLKGAAYRDRDRKGDIGTLVHEWIEADRIGKPLPPASPLVQPYLDSFKRFVDDFQPEYVMAEASVFNRSQRYAGTLDAIVRLKRPLLDEEPRSFVLDAKSGKDVYPEVALQLAAYRYAEFVGAPDGSEQPMPAVDGALALHLSPTGYRLIEVRADEQIFKAFLFVREVYRFANETSKQVLGPEYGAQVRTAAALAQDVADAPRAETKEVA